MKRMALRVELPAWVRAIATRITPPLRDVRRSRKLVPLTTIESSLLLLSFVYSQYGEMYRQQKQLAERWEQQQVQQQTDSRQESTEDTLIRLVIPKIDLTSFVVEGTNHHSLLIGPGHMSNTAEPGEAG